jgi:hypothetical protein
MTNRVFRGCDAKIYMHDIEIGYCKEVSVSYESPVEPYYGIENPNMIPVTSIDQFGLVKIEGSLKRAWLNIYYLRLLFGGDVPTIPNAEFDLRIFASSDTGSPALYLYNCRFTKGSISIPASGWIEESYDFMAFSATTAEASPPAPSAYIYVGLMTGDSGYSKGGITKLNIDPFSKISTLLFATGEMNAESVAISGSYLYAGLRLSPNGKIVKVDLNTFTQVGTLTLSSGANVRDLLVDGTYLYAALGTSPAKIVKIDLNTFTEVSTLTLLTGENDARALTKAEDGFLYVGIGLPTPPNLGKIAKINLSSFTRVSVLTLDTYERMPYSLTSQGHYLYVGLRQVSGYPARIIKIDLSTFTKVSTLNVSGVSSDLVWDVVIKDNYLYASRIYYISKVDLTTFTWVDSCYTTGISTGGGLLIIGNNLYEAQSYVHQVSKIDLLTFTLTASLALGVYDENFSGITS